MNNRGGGGGVSNWEQNRELEAGKGKIKFNQGLTG